MTVNIRYAKIEDAASLAFVNATSFQLAFKGIIPDDVLKEKFSYDRLLERFKKELEEKTTENSLVFLNDKAVGMQTFARDGQKERSADEIDIWRIYVLPEYWGTGLGETLMEWGLEELKSKEYKKVALWVVDENARARKFYEKMGFIYENEFRIINPGREINELRYVKYLV